MNYVDSTGVTIFALLADGSLLLRPLAAPRWHQPLCRIVRFGE
jgi:hypothetical protein